MLHADYAPPEPIRFAASCNRCPDFEGRPRSDNLVALADFDRHAANHGAAVELCLDCNHAADGHDRRAEDGICQDCQPGDPCSAQIIERKLS